MIPIFTYDLYLRAYTLKELTQSPQQYDFPRFPLTTEKEIIAVISAKI